MWTSEPKLKIQISKYDDTEFNTFVIRQEWWDTVVSTSLQYGDIVTYYINTCKCTLIGLTAECVSSCIDKIFIGHTVAEQYSTVKYAWGLRCIEGPRV